MLKMRLKKIVIEQRVKKGRIAAGKKNASRPWGVEEGINLPVCGEVGI